MPDKDRDLARIRRQERMVGPVVYTIYAVIALVSLALLALAMYAAARWLGVV